MDPYLEGEMWGPAQRYLDYLTRIQRETSDGLHLLNERLERLEQTEK